MHLTFYRAEMSSKILIMLLIAGLASVKVTDAQPAQGVVDALGPLFEAISKLISEAIQSGDAKDTSGLMEPLTKLVATAMSDPSNESAIAAQMAELQQAVDKVANCGVLEEGKLYHIQSVNGSYKEGYIQSSLSAIDSERGAILTRQKKSASKFYVVKKSCNTYGLCVRGLCMSRCQGCKTGINGTQTVAFHLSDTTGSYSQWTLSFIGDVADGRYNLKSDIEQYLNYVRLPTGSAVVTLNETPLPESEFKFIEAEPCEAMLEDGQEYYLKTGTGEYVVVKGVLSYIEQIDQASATKFKAKQWECNVYGFCITGINGAADKCMSRCQDCVSETADRQSVQFHVPNSFRPYSQWKFFNDTETGLLEIYAEPKELYGNIYFGMTSSGAKQLVLDVNSSLQFQFIKVT